MAAQMNRNDGETRKYKRKQKKNEKQWKEKKIEEIMYRVWNNLR